MKFKLASITLAVSMVMLMSPALELNKVYANSFTSEWAKPTVDAMSNAGLIPNSLKNDADFREDISREEFAELITTYFNKVKKQTSIPSSSDSKFTDTNNPLITLANQLGIVGGYPDGSFKPNATITRQEIAVMANQAERQLSNISQSKDVKKFTDNRNIAPWAQEGVGSLSKAGGIGGYPDGTFKPTNKMSKQEAIALVGNLATKAGLIAKPTAPVVPPVGGQTKAEAQALYQAEMGKLIVTGLNKVPVPVDRINSFRVVENGTPFEVNGVKVLRVNLEEKSGTGIWITQEGTGESVSASAHIYLFDGNSGVWSNVERGSTGHWWVSSFKPELVKAVMFTDGNGNRILVKIK